MDAVYPVAASTLARSRRRRGEPRQRHRTMPVTFAEIKEVDEEKEDSDEAQAASMGSVAMAVSPPDDHLGREFAEFRRRRARRDPPRNLAERTEARAVQPASRASTEPRPDAGPS